MKIKSETWVVDLDIELENNPLGEQMCNACLSRLTSKYLAKKKKFFFSRYCIGGLTVVVALVVTICDCVIIAMTITRSMSKKHSEQEKTTSNI